jgi:hypothetical protein
MIWIILASTTVLVANLGTDNGQALEDIFESFPQQFTLGSSLAVDTFFFLSGLLTTYVDITLSLKVRLARGITEEHACTSNTPIPISLNLLLTFPTLV